MLGSPNSGATPGSQCPVPLGGLTKSIPLSGWAALPGFPCHEWVVECAFALARFLDRHDGAPVILVHKSLQPSRPGCGTVRSHAAGPNLVDDNLTERRSGRDICLSDQPNPDATSWIAATTMRSSTSTNVVTVSR